MTTFRFEITTPERVVYRDEVVSVTLPTVEGEITVLAHHLPVVTVLKPGELVIRKDGHDTPFAVSGGFVEVRPDKLVVLADTAERFDEIDERRAEEARQRAEALRSQVAADDVEFARIASQLDRELVRLKVVRKYRHRGRTGIAQEGIRKNGQT